MNCTTAESPSDMKRDIGVRFLYTKRVTVVPAPGENRYLAWFATQACPKRGKACATTALSPFKHSQRSDIQDRKCRRQNDNPHRLSFDEVDHRLRTCQEI